MHQTGQNVITKVIRTQQVITGYAGVSIVFLGNLLDVHNLIGFAVNGIGHTGFLIVDFAGGIGLRLPPLGIHHRTKEAKQEQTDNHHQTDNTQLGTEESAQKHLGGRHQTHIFIQGDVICHDFLGGVFHFKIVHIAPPYFSFTRGSTQAYIRSARSTPITLRTARNML